MFIISGIIKKLIAKELRKLMKDFIQPILDLIKTLVQPQQGTKFLITVAGMAAIYFMASAGILTDAITITIGCIVVAYYVADIYHKGKKPVTTVLKPTSYRVPPLPPDFGGGAMGNPTVEKETP